MRAPKAFVPLTVRTPSFGSRNLGKRIEEHYHRIAARMCERFHSPLPDKDLAFLPIDEPTGHDYFTDMLFALRYAKENRRRMMEAMKATLAEFVPGTTSSNRSSASSPSPR